MSRPKVTKIIIQSHREEFCHLNVHILIWQPFLCSVYYHGRNLIKTDQTSLSIICVDRYVNDLCVLTLCNSFSRIDSTFLVEAIQVSYVLRSCIDVLTFHRVRIRQVNGCRRLHWMSSSHRIECAWSSLWNDLSAVSASEDVSDLIY